MNALFDNAYRRAARWLYEVEGRCEIPLDAKLRFDDESPDGRWIHAQIFITDADARRHGAEDAPHWKTDDDPGAMSRATGEPS